MPCPANIVIGGTVYRWRDIQRLRREQLAAWKAECQAAQPELLPGMPERRPPAHARTPAGRYYAARQSTPFTLLDR
jgi:hypothetical protein